MCATNTGATKRKIGVADVLKAGFRWGRFKFSLQQWKVFNCIVACRSGKLGAHLLCCTQCKRIHFIPLSCRNRHCPSCQGAAATDWLTRQEQALLPVQYFHVVFTLPHALNPLVRANPKELYRALFAAASQTLLQFAEKNLGAQLGVTAVLHTWGQTLWEHYHLHCIVTGGGLANDGDRWVSSGNKGFLFSTKALSQVYRGKYISELKKLYEAKKLTFHGKSAPLARRKAFDHLIRSLYRKDWVVYSKAPFAGPKQVLSYLSRYTHRVAISDSRILALDQQHQQVTLRYKDYRKGGRWETMDLDVETFIKRLSLHILPKRFTKIRHYGILSTRNRHTKIPKCRQLLGFREPTEDEHSNVAKEETEKRFQLPEKCPYCQCESLEYLDITHDPLEIAKERAPPVAA